MGVCSYIARGSPLLIPFNFVILFFSTLLASLIADLDSAIREFSEAKRSLYISLNSINPLDSKDQEAVMTSPTDSNRQTLEAEYEKHLGAINQAFHFLIRFTEQQNTVGKRFHDCLSSLGDWTTDAIRDLESFKLDDKKKALTYISQIQDGVEQLAKVVDAIHVRIGTEIPRIQIEFEQMCAINTALIHNARETTAAGSSQVGIDRIQNKVDSTALLGDDHHLRIVQRETEMKKQKVLEYINTLLVRENRRLHDQLVLTQLHGMSHSASIDLQGIYGNSQLMPLPGLGYPDRAQNNVITDSGSTRSITKLNHRISELEKENEERTLLSAKITQLKEENLGLRINFDNLGDVNDCLEQAGSEIRRLEEEKASVDIKFRQAQEEIKKMAHSRKLSKVCCLELHFKLRLTKTS
jgi:hypothetical protein